MKWLTSFVFPTGQYTLAKLTALELRAQLPLYSSSTDVFGEMIDFLEMFLAVPIHVMVRFGRWTDILCEPLPPGATVSDQSCPSNTRIGRIESSRGI